MKTLTVRQTAQKLGVTLKYVFDLLYAGRLRGAKKRGRAWSIPEDAVEERITRTKVSSRIER